MAFRVKYPVLTRMLVAIVVLMGGTGVAFADPIDPFVGNYQGTSIENADHELKARDLDVSISKTNQGFTIDWSTVIYKEDGREKTVGISIDFYPTNRPDIYGSAMHKGLFGRRVPNDPLKGQPFVWARIKDKTLTVHAMYILDNGGYEMQVYDRTLTDDGDLKLDFRRYRDGEPVRSVEGKLTRTDKY